MSGIYISGMEMPDKCIKCKLMSRCGKDDLDFVCMPARIYVDDLTNAYKPRPDWCPLVPVPDHGRLIDADAEVARVQNLYNKAVAKDPEMGCVNVYEGEIAVLKLAPTVIPAEEG